jgi:ribonuclease HI
MKHINLYCDGSYNGQYYSWGYVIVTDKNNILFCGSGYDNQKEALQQYQIVGEIFGVVYGVQKCVAMGYKNISVYYDLINLEKWATGKWKRNNKYSQLYYSYMSQFKQNGVCVSWVKVKAHSGNLYNDLADNLAKNVLKN